MENKQNDIIEELKAANSEKLGKISNEMTNALNRFSKKMQDTRAELWDREKRPAKNLKEPLNTPESLSPDGELKQWQKDILKKHPWITLDLDKQAINKLEQLKKDIIERSYIMSKEEFQAFCKPKNDPVNHPSHYTDGKIEVIDFIEDKKLNFHLANAVKYISRAGKKDPSKEIEDLKKAQWYLTRYIHKKEAEEKLKAGGDIDGDEYLSVDLQKDKFAKKEKDMTVYICNYLFVNKDDTVYEFPEKVFDTEEKAKNYILKRMQDFCKFQMHICSTVEDRAYWENYLNNLTVEKTEDIGGKISIINNDQQYGYKYIAQKVF